MMSTTPANAASGHRLSTGSGGPERVVPSGRQVIVLLLAYLGLHVTIRSLLSSSVDLDESEQVVLSQWLSWGYGTAPPLYTWIQMVFFSIFGQSVFALALLKNLVLFCIYLFTYLNARIVTRDEMCSVAAAISLLFIPQIAWESQRDLTHSVLGSAFATVTLFSFLWLNEKRSTWSYLALGIAMGLGSLSKFNYLLWAVGLLGATMTLPQFRPALTDKRILLSLATCVVILVPYGLWAFQFKDLAFENMQKLHMTSSSWTAPVLKGLTNLAVAVPAFIGPLAAIYCVMFWKAPSRPENRSLSWPYDKVLLRAFVIVLGIVVLLVICFRATGFRERWFQPVLISAPVLAAALVRNRMSVIRLRRLAALGGVVMLSVAVAIPGRILFGEKLHREEPLMRPYDAIASQIRTSYPNDAWLIADTTPTAGNLRMSFSDKPVFTVETARLFPDNRRPFVAVWDARRSDEIPRNLREWLGRNGVTIDSARLKFFEAIYKYHHSRRMRMGTIEVQ